MQISVKICFKFAKIGYVHRARYQVGGDRQVGMPRGVGRYARSQTPPLPPPKTRRFSLFFGVIFLVSFGIFWILIVTFWWFSQCDYRCIFTMYFQLYFDNVFLQCNLRCSLTVRFTLQFYYVFYCIFTMYFYGLTVGVFLQCILQCSFTMHFYNVCLQCIFTMYVTVQSLYPGRQGALFGSRSCGT